MEQAYPKHIYEPIRREIAVSYIRHELRKYLPSLRDKESWERIDGDVATWFDKAPFLFPVRDFWNGFYGILMGFKLLIHLDKFVTAENVSWERKKIALADLTVTGFNTREMGATYKDLFGKTIIEHYAMRNEEREKHLKEVELFYEKTEKRTGDPVIVTQKKGDENDIWAVYDGNARVMMAILRGDTNIDAYVSTFTSEGKILNNYWVPTVQLLEITHVCKTFFREKDDEGYLAGVKVLKKIIGNSESAVYEMKKRVVPGESDFETKIKTDLGL